MYLREITITVRKIILIYLIARNVQEILVIVKSKINKYINLIDHIIVHIVIHVF